ncbi:flagellar protein FlaG [Thermomonas sp.]|uniref:flagellar protein FlaG n=1 Tax=Thermomonas sp. TaxID=1971895 RepID=UPI0035B2F52F
MSSIASVHASPVEARPAPTSVAGASSRAAVALSQAAPEPAKPPVEVARNDAGKAAAEAAIAANQARSELAAKELQKQLDEAMAQSRTQTSLRFRVDEDVKRIVVSVVDENGKTIMQIPDAAALALAKRLAETGSGLLDQHA